MHEVIWVINAGIDNFIYIEGATLSCAANNIAFVFMSPTKIQVVA